MTLVRKYYCEICGTEKRVLTHWFMAEVLSSGVLLSHWHDERAELFGMHHFCGEAHAQTFISRYLSSTTSMLGRGPAPLNPEEKDLTAVQSHLVNKVLQQSGEMSSESEEIFDLLAAAEAALKGRVTVDALSSDQFDA